MTAKKPEQDSQSVEQPEESKTPARVTCGIIMPIATMGEYSEGHWRDVKAILEKAIRMAGFDPRIVSDSEDATVIQKSIVQNIYDDQIVVCDVSGKNPNVMFELGMRLAFDKPVVIVKDDKTGYSFDTGVIEHINYRRDLRYADTEIFMSSLSGKIKATVGKAKDPKNKTFLSNFGHFEVAKIESTQIPADKVMQRILDEVSDLKSAMTKASNVDAIEEVDDIEFSEIFHTIEYHESRSEEVVEIALNLMASYPEVIHIQHDKERNVLYFYAHKKLSLAQKKRLTSLVNAVTGDLILPF
jgi:hypothetical protein